MIGAGEKITNVRTSLDSIPEDAVRTLQKFMRGYDEASRAIEAGKVQDPAAKYNERLKKCETGACDDYDKGVLQAYREHFDLGGKMSGDTLRRMVEKFNNNYDQSGAIKAVTRYLDDPRVLEDEKQKIINKIVGTMIRGKELVNLVNTEPKPEK